MLHRSVSFSRTSEGFTLIELSVVLVIIGLIVGGVLVGQNLIAASEVRATITQIEKYNTAANTFRGKFGYLPSDINPTAAAQFGFAARGSYAGEGDGNGIIEGISTNASGNNNGVAAASGEAAMFWVDLSSAAAGNLIDGGFNTATATTTCNTNGCIPGTAIGNYFPVAKLGRGNYIYVWSGGYGMPGVGSNGINYFGLSAVSSTNSTQPVSSADIPVSMAYAIDKKVDDGYPQSGNVMAMYVNQAAPPPTSSIGWAAGGGNSGTYGAGPLYGPSTAATQGTSTTCYDNGNANGATQNYSVEINSGAGANCALSFKFQ